MAIYLFSSFCWRCLKLEKEKKFSWEVTERFPYKHFNSWSLPSFHPRFCRCFPHPNEFCPNFLQEQTVGAWKNVYIEIKESLRFWIILPLCLHSPRTQVAYWTNLKGFKIGKVFIYTFVYKNQSHSFSKAFPSSTRGKLFIPLARDGSEIWLKQAARFYPRWNIECVIKTIYLFDECSEIIAMRDCHNIFFI